ncbi:MAG: GGDEF domain-containing protein [Magnetospirillum sp. WYHS-4]
MNGMRMLFGDAEFHEGEEYRKFQYRFTCAILLFSVLITAIFQVAVLEGQAQADPSYLNVSRAYLAISVLYYAVLRGRPSRLGPVAWTYAGLSWLLHLSTFLLNTPDELRIVWFVLNLPGVYLVLGSAAGIGFTVLSMAAVVAANGFLDTPYSSTAIVTCLMGMVYLSVFFHAFAARSISFHHAMVEANRKLAEMAARDPLTGLFNARAYYRLCEGALRQSQRSGRPFAMLFVDLDHFKSINDKYGHEAGDTVLRSVAERLQASLRQSDIVGRIGGEEFSVLLPDSDMDGARDLAEKLRLDIEALMPDIGSERLRITASIGVAASRPTLISIAEVQSQADEAMYVAKRQGRNRVTCIGDGTAPGPA